MMSVVKGRLLGLGVGPGDPELITLKALRLLRAAPVVGYFVAKGKKGNAFGIIEAHLDQALRLPLVYPVTTEKLEPPLCYETIISDFYDTAAEQLAAHLDAGRDVAVICEGDPFFYGSYMYLHDRLATRYESEVVPGVCSMLGGAAVLGAPLVYRNQSLSVLSGVLPGGVAPAPGGCRRGGGDEARPQFRQGPPRAGRAWPRAPRAVRRAGDHGQPADRAVGTGGADGLAVLSLIVVPGDKWQEGPAVSDAQQVPAIVILGQGALDTARRVQARIPGRWSTGSPGGSRPTVPIRTSATPCANCIAPTARSSPVRRRHRHSQPGAVVATQGSGAAGAGPGRGRQRGAAARRAGRGQPAGAGNRRGAGRGAGDHHQRRAALRHLRAQPARRLCPGRPGAGQALRCRFARWPAGARRGCRRLARRGPFAARPGGGAGDSRDALGACAAGRGTADPSALRAGGARTCRRGGGRGAPGAGRCRPGRGGARRLAGRQRADGRSAPAGRRRCARRTAALPAAGRSRCAPAPGLARRRAGRRPAGGGRRALGDGPHRPASRPTHSDRPGAAAPS